MSISKQGKARFGIILALSVLVMNTTCLDALARRRPSLRMPINEKLTEGSGPATNDYGSGADFGPAADISGAEPIAKVADNSAVLAPVSLGDALSEPALATGTTDANEDSSGGPYLKSTITVTGFVPKGPIDPSSRSIFVPSKSVSVGGGMGSNSIQTKMINQAEQVSLMPLPLMESESETEAKIRCVLDAEKEQLADLWEATLTKSPDIQFVIQKLMPTSTPGRASTIMMRMLSNAVFGAMGTMTMLSPNMGTYAMSTAGTQMLSSVVGLQESKVAKKARLSQTEAIMLYNMVRTTADKLVANYRNYKKTIGQMTSASADLADLQSMVREAREGQDSAKQVEMEYIVRKAQRDVNAISEDLKRYRQSLSDLAGVEAVAKLDQQLDVEQHSLFDSTASADSPTKTASRPDMPQS